MRADRRMYLNADRSRVVEEGDPSAAYLLAAEGDDITNEDARKYGLGKKKADADEAKPDEAPAADAKAEEDKLAESKMQAGPAENKARTIRAGKADEGK